MTTSGVYAFTVNRDQVIRQAMLNIRKLDPDESPTPRETTDCTFVLNMMVKQWMAKADFSPGLKIWTRRRGHLFLHNNQYQYTVGPGATGWTLTYVSPTTTVASNSGTAAITVSSPTGIATNYFIGIETSAGDLFWTTVLSVVGSVVNLNANLPANVSIGAQVFAYQTVATQPVVIETAVLRDIFNQDIPLRYLTIQDYDMLPSKTDPTNISDPGAILYEFGLTNSNLFIDVAGAQDVTKHIVLTYMEAIQDFVNPTDTPEYPQEWFLALCWGLAKEITPMFHANWDMLMQNNFERSLITAQRKDSERRTEFFQPGNDE
jgi:hypothetical protein